MKNLQHLEQAAEKCAADLLNLKNAIEALKAKEAAPVWPMSVEDFKGKPAFFVSHTEGGRTTNGHVFTHSDHNVYPTIEAANSAAAFSQLSRLIHHINGGDVYECGRAWFRVCFGEGELHKDGNTVVFALPACLYFKNEADRDRSMIDHAPLWIQYFTGKKA